MTRESVITEIFSFIDSGCTADDLLAATAAVDSTPLWDAAIAMFGSWERAVVEALMTARRAAAIDERAAAEDDDRESRAPVDVPRPERRVGPDAAWTAFVLADSGAVLSCRLDRLAATAAPTLLDLPDGPPDEAAPRAILPGSSDTGLVILTSTGQGVSLDARLLPSWDPSTLVRPLSDRFGDLDRDETASFVLPRKVFRERERIHFVSRGGQIKITDTVEYGKLGGTPLPSVLLRDGDTLLAAFGGSPRAHVFVASSHARAIVFDAAEIRSQGRKATGVRAIALEDDATAVGAFVAEPDGWLVLATRQGFLKRMRVDEFRPQGRGGGGLQTARLSPGDFVASVAAVRIDGDVLILTDGGRYARFPAYDVPLAARGARGERLFELADGESILRVEGITAGTLV